MAGVETIRQIVRFQPDTEIVFSRTLRDQVLVKFRIQFRARIEARWYNIVRYDHAHGPVHRHRCWLPGEPSEIVGAFVSLEDALNWCLADLEKNAEAALRQAQQSYTN